LRRNPDLKWRQNPEAIAQMNAKQARILAAAATLVKPGGRLVYATCSVLPQENAQIVDAFLREHTEFTPLDTWALLAAAAIDIARHTVDVGDARYLQLWPHVHHCDGFFAAVLERSRAAA
jgi:16S rRNA (cytosine967-C5)-methyltransferase